MGLAAIPAVMSAVGTGFSIFGQIRAGRAQAQAAAAQAALDRYNAEVARRLAADARRRGVVAVQNAQLNTRQLIGAQRAVLASRNIDISSGSALALVGESAAFGALDAATIKHNFEREAIGLETQQAGFNASAAMGDRAAKDIRIGTAINAFSTALGGIGNTVSLLPRFQV